MFSTTVMVSAGMIAGSFTAGTGIYYLHNTQSKQIKKQQIDQLLSLIISFIIYLWIAKIALQLPLLMKSPMAVLAYPSNSFHFYFATGLCLLHTAYIFRKKLNEARLFFQSFSFIMLSTLLVHEFLLIITDVHHQLSLYFICLTALVFCYVLLYQKQIMINLLSFCLAAGLYWHSPCQFTMDTLYCFSLW